MGNEQQNKRNIKRDKYSTTCVIFNSLTVLLMTAVAIVIQILIGVPVLVIILISIVLFFIFAWIEEHYISRFVNTLVEKTIKEDPD